MSWQKKYRKIESRNFADLRFCKRFDTLWQEIIGGERNCRNKMVDWVLF